MSGLVAKWDDFSKGEAGWIDKTMMPPGFFTGEQIMLYRDGSIGPRSGIVNLAPTGLPAGTLYGIGYVHPGVSGVTDYIWIHKGTTIGRIPVYNNAGLVLTGQAFAACTGAFATTPIGLANADYVEYSPDALLIAIDADKAYMVDWSVGANGTLTALTGSSAAAGAHIELWNEFLLLAGNPTFPNRIWFSAPGNFNSWPAANFFDISGGITGAGSPTITSLRRLRDMLIVHCDTGQMFIVTNLTSDPSTVQIRQFLQGDIGSGPQSKAVVRDRSGQVWFTRRDEMPFPGLEFFDSATAVPVSFDGAQRIEILRQSGYLRQPDQTSDRLSRTAGVQGRHEQSIVLTDQSGRALINRGGAWTRHKLGTIAGKILGTGIRGELFCMNDTFTSVFAWLFELDQPPRKFRASALEPLPWNPLEGTLDMSPMPWVAFPEVRAEDPFTVQRVEVYLTSHATLDDVNNNHLEVFVQQYDKVDADEKIDTGNFAPPDSETAAGVMVAGGVTVGCTTTFDEAPPAKDHRRRVAFFTKPDGIPAQGIRVLLKNVRGVSIHAVHVYGDTVRNERP